MLFLPLTLLGQTKQSFNLTLLSGQGTDLETLADGDVHTGWFPGWNQGDYPAKVLLEFDSSFYITKIRFYDWVGTPKLTFKTIDGSVLLEKTASQYGQWQEFQVLNPNKMHQMTFEINSIQGDRPVTEIEIFGNGDSVPPAPVQNLSGDALKLGVNGFFWIPLNLNPTKLIRVYQMYGWTWGQNGNKFEPTFDANGNLDSYLQEAKQDNTRVIFCINKIPGWLSDQVGNWNWQRIHWQNLSGANPEDYFDVSRYAWQLAARYGKNTYPSNLISIDKTQKYYGEPINEIRTGLGLLDYVELENEPDRPWNDITGKYTPQQLAAFCSAIWDGHEGKLGIHCGIKNADPNIKIVLPGISTINLWYLDEMKKWFEQNRNDKRFCADVINVHHYSNSENPWPSDVVNLGGLGISPEPDHLEYRLDELKLYVEQNFENMEVWFGEFGYDTQPPSTGLSQYTQLYGNHSAEELQGQWLLRSYLYGLKSGMDKIIMFNLCDEDSALQGYCFGSSGLLTSQITGFQKKKSWDDVSWLVNELNGYSFFKDRTLDPDVRVFEFRNRYSSKFFYFCSTTNDNTKEFKIGRKHLLATEKVQVIKTDRFLKNIKIKKGS